MTNLNEDAPALQEAPARAVIELHNRGPEGVELVFPDGAYLDLPAGRRLRLPVGTENGFRPARGLPGNRIDFRRRPADSEQTTCGSCGRPTTFGVLRADPGDECRHCQRIAAAGGES